ncbi:hypothetical protein RAB80_008466 [Fusarium oxysporum f. sp. vasinfectum]|nr:hypothetical protein RAB80_008466 [Fusarium oxysporum f. sp. vasinfectum]KAK2932937.1 hypothetical protein FoTM2_007397 [Fusarium oxysporum f. sp. vasinfectum]
MYPFDVSHHIMMDEATGAKAGALSAYTSEDMNILLDVTSKSSNVSTPVDYTTRGHTTGRRQQHLQNSRKMVKHVASQTRSSDGLQQERDSGTNLLV